MCPEAHGPPPYTARTLSFKGNHIFSFSASGTSKVAGFLSKWLASPPQLRRTATVPRSAAALAGSWGPPGYVRRLGWWLHPGTRTRCRAPQPSSSSRELPVRSQRTDRTGSPTNTAHVNPRLFRLRFSQPHCLQRAEPPSHLRGRAPRAGGPCGGPRRHLQNLSF